MHTECFFQQYIQFRLFKWISIWNDSSGRQKSFKNPIIELLPDFSSCKLSFQLFFLKSWHWEEKKKIKDEKIMTIIGAEGLG
jgi:hypothetical protein